MKTMDSRSIETVSQLLQDEDDGQQDIETISQLLKDEDDGQ